MDSRPDIRVSDAEREEVVERLREHTAAGRLTPQELDERIDEAYAARTRGELDGVMRELPVSAPPVADVQAARRERARRQLYASVGSYVTTNATLVIIWALTGAGSFWPIWVIAFWGIALIAQAWHMLGPGGGEEEPEDRHRRRRRRHLPPPARR
jgi:Domain of unknown function (DUF1707)/2TM domain